MTKERFTKEAVARPCQRNMSDRCLSLESTYIPVAIRRKVLKRDNYKCVWCGEPEEHDVSHFVQKNYGGITIDDNLVTTCDKCKRKRHYDSPFEFISRLRLEQIDFPKEVGAMNIKVVFAGGQEVEGTVEVVPTPETKAFYVRHLGNGTRELVFTEPGMRIVELGGEE